MNTMDKSQWPRCLLWHGWLPSLSGVNGASLRAESEEEAARNQLENCMDAYSAQTLLGWEPPHDFDADRVAGNMTLGSFAG